MRETREPTDIGGRDDLDVLLRRFYTAAFADPLIGPFFTEVAGTDLEVHLPRIADFWERALFRTAAYGRDAFAPHAALHSARPLAPAHFGRWVQLWHAAVDGLHRGPLADRAKAMGERISVLPLDSTARRHRTTEKREHVMAPQMIFVNLPVKDLGVSRTFYEKLGYTINPQFSDDSTACVVISDTIFVMLLTEEKFLSFTAPGKAVADASATTQVLLSLNAESREQADELADRALASGGGPAKEPLDMGFMYGRSFADPDGHHWEVFWMDPAAMEG